MQEPTVIYEDEHLLAIDKPSGLVVHAGVNTDRTLSDWLCEQYPALQEVGETYTDQQGNTIHRPGIVHRLDRETSGAMLIAKDQETFAEIKKHFQKGKIEKEYHAFVYGKPKNTRGTVRLPIGKSRSDFRKQTTRNIRGMSRDACTEYAVIAACKENTSLISFYPQTGRTHQIRVHAQSLGTPIVCDARYAPKHSPLLGFTRLALHARRLSLQLHYQSERVDIVAEYPKDFAAAKALCERV